MMETKEKVHSSLMNNDTFNAWLYVGLHYFLVLTTKPRFSVKRP